MQFPHKQKQFILPSVALVPIHFVAMANLWNIASTGNPVFTRRDYDAIAEKIRAGLIPSLRVSSNGVSRPGTRQGGQLFFDPRFGTEDLVGKVQAGVIEELADFKYKAATARSAEGLRQARELAREYHFTPPIQESIPFSEPEAVEAIEVKPEAAGEPLKPSLAKRLVEGIEDVKGSNDAMLAALRENTAVMNKLLACWQPTAA